MNSEVIESSEAKDENKWLCNGKERGGRGGEDEPVSHTTYGRTEDHVILGGA